MKALLSDLIQHGSRAKSSRRLGVRAAQMPPAMLLEVQRLKEACHAGFALTRKARAVLQGSTATCSLGEYPSNARLEPVCIIAQAGAAHHVGRRLAPQRHKLGFCSRSRTVGLKLCAPGPSPQHRTLYLGRP